MVKANRYAEALAVQDACNLSGVAHSLIEMCSVIRAEGGDSDAIRHDPAVRLFVAKLADLAGLDYTWPADSSAACERMKA
jgi:hypothetical protein